MIFTNRTIHEGINPPGFCTICNKSFPNVNKLRSHKILEHNTDEKYLGWCSINTFLVLLQHGYQKYFC